MKTITLIYGADDSSKAALNEIEYIQNKYSGIIIKDNISFIIKTDLEYREIDATIHKYPTLFFIDDLKVEKIEGYNLENLNNNYGEYFLDIFKLRDFNPFPSGIWNEEEGRGEAPILLEEMTEEYTEGVIPPYSGDEEKQNWVISKPKPLPFTYGKRIKDQK